MFRSGALQPTLPFWNLILFLLCSVVDPELLPGSGTRKIHSWIRIHNTAKQVLWYCLYSVQCTLYTGCYPMILALFINHFTVCLLRSTGHYLDCFCFLKSFLSHFLYLTLFTFTISPFSFSWSFTAYGPYLNLPKLHLALTDKLLFFLIFTAHQGLHFLLLHWHNINRVICRPSDSLLAKAPGQNSNLGRAV